MSSVQFSRISNSRTEGVAWGEVAGVYFLAGFDPLLIHIIIYTRNDVMSISVLGWKASLSDRTRDIYFVEGFTLLPVTD